MVFERNERGFIKRETQRLQKNSKIGRVVEVFEHTEDDDGTNFEADVVILGENEEERSAPIQGVSGSSIAIPRVGDKVIIEYLDGEKKNPVIRNTIYTNKDRPPKGKAGMWRQRFDGPTGQAGPGDFYLTGYTEYDGDPSSEDKGGLTAEKTFLRLAKKQDDNDVETDQLPMSIEIMDDANAGEAYIKLEANREATTFSSVPYGIKIDLTDGSFKLLDAEGYGIVSDGAGNFTWHHETVDFSEGTTDAGL